MHIPICMNQFELTNKEKFMLYGLVKYPQMTDKELSKKLDIPCTNIAAIGNSCFDIPMFETCSLSIAFNPLDSCVTEAADIVIRDKDLSKIIPFINPYI